MLLALLIYLGFSLTASAGIYWIAYEQRGQATAVIAAALTLAFFLALAAALYLWVLPELRSLG